MSVDSYLMWNKNRKGILTASCKSCSTTNRKTKFALRKAARHCHHLPSPLGHTAFYRL